MNPGLGCCLWIGLGIGIPVGCMIGSFVASRGADERIRRFRLRAHDVVMDEVCESARWYFSPQAEKHLADDFNRHEANAYWSGARAAAAIVLNLPVQAASSEIGEK